MRIFLNALVRALVVGLLPVLVFDALDARFNAEGGANIGGGILVLAIALVGSFVWAMRDGRFRADRGASKMWVLAAILTFVLQAVRHIAEVGMPTDSESWSIIATVASITAVLVLAGGGVGAAVGVRQHRA